MSESDDTDLLLLIPPDFFVIPSDSEESLQSFKRSSSDHRFKELISQVNELEERVNFIENKDSTITHNFPEANRVNQTVDYSLSFDTSNYHNVSNRDLALRLYSLASADFRFGCSSDNTTVQYLEPYIMSSLGSKAHYPHQTFPPTTDSKPESPANRVTYVNPHTRAISVEPSNHQIVNSGISVDYSAGSSAIKCMTADEADGPHRISHHSQPFNFNFLNEIDEFLESKNRLDKSQNYNDSFDSECQGEEKSNKLKVIDKRAECKYEHQPFIKLPSSTDSVSYNSCGNKQPYVGQMDGFTQIDAETIFKHRSSDTNSHAIPCTAEQDEQSEMEKYRQEFNDHQNEIKEDVIKESSSSKYSFLVKDLNFSKLSKNSMYNSSHSKFLKESSINGCMDKQPVTVTSNSTSPPRRSSFIAGSHSTSDMWESENSRRRSTTSYSGMEDNTCISSNKNSDSLECEKDPVQFEFKTGTAWNKDSQSYENLPTHKNKTLISESFLQDKGIRFPVSANGLYQLDNFVHFGDAVPQSKYEKDILSKDMQNCSDYDTPNLNAIRDKLRNYQASEFRNDGNSKLPSFSLHSDENVKKQTAENLHCKKEKIGDSIVQTGVTEETHEHQKGFLFVPDYQSELTTPKPPKNLLTNEHAFNEVRERNQMSHKSGEGIGKTAGPVFADDGYYSSIGTGSSAINFLSLSNLWGREAKELQKREVMTVEQKLEEEHYRRKHCENVIQKLQCTVLEQQQKLAVAMRVDQSKDHTIQQLQTAWKRLVNHWHELEEQRHSVSVKYSEEKEKHQQNVKDIMQKIKQCEVELSKALDLAKGYKEKSEMIEQKIKEQENSYAEEKQTLQISLQEEQKHVMEAEKKLEAVECELSEIKEKLEEAEKKAYAEKESVVKCHEEMKNVQHLLGNLQVDITTVKEENESLRLRLKEERARNGVADQQTASLKLALDEIRRNEKMLQSELKERSNILEKTKAELRDYYQQQVELVVQEKLIEFQTQLDAAEASLQQEMEQKEKLALEAATKQIKHITEKNLLEVKLLEEKHREELHLYKLQLAQATQQINQLQAQLQSYSNRKTEIVEKLHTVMETQWQEALRIISGNSPLVQTFQDHQHIISEKDISDSIPDRDHKLTISGNYNAVPPLLVPHSSSSSTTDEIPFSKEDQLTYRANNGEQCSRGVDCHPENADVVKKYIEMLLNRPAGHPVNNDTSLEKNSIMQTSAIEENMLPKWGKIMENQQIIYNTGKIFPCSIEDTKCIHVNTNSKVNKSDKPPWK